MGLTTTLFISLFFSAPVEELDTMDGVGDLGKWRDPVKSDTLIPRNLGSFGTQLLVDLVDPVGEADLAEWIDPLRLLLPDSGGICPAIYKNKSNLSSLKLFGVKIPLVAGLYTDAQSVALAMVQLGDGAPDHGRRAGSRQRRD